MSPPIEDYGLIGDTQTAALVSRLGAIDWLCLPRFDSGACFAALLGDERYGHWTIAPATGVRRTSRRYRGDTLVLETELEAHDGTVRIVDFMPPRERKPDLVRIVEGVRGRPRIRSTIVLRFDYGSITPWLRPLDGAVAAIGGPDAVVLHTPAPVEARSREGTLVSELVVPEGERVPFVLTWFPSAEALPDPIDVARALADTDSFWHAWADRCRVGGPHRDAVVRSLVTLKALTYAPTGGIVAAATTSLPERLGGVRNWDYRYCWVRDATFTLHALLESGFKKEAEAWRDWLLRAVAGDPRDLQIMYGPAGERRLPELELPWLPGYEGSSPVRVGNRAHEQRQLDVYGELMDMLHQAREAGIPAETEAWELQRALLEALESRWREPDAGIWEVRGPPRHFTHSKVMAWVAFDRAARAVEAHGRDGPADRWRRLAHEIHAEACREGFDADRNAFVQSYGSSLLDASLLLIPVVGFLPPDDPRVVGTVEAVRRDLMHDGLVQRYPATDEAQAVDGLPPGEGAFLACSFWLADALVRVGRRDEAEALFGRLLALRTDLGLLAEEYDPEAKRLVGNFPQAFSHVGLVNAAAALAGTMARRPQGDSAR
ncbi:MAG TPA: glycoside hydrolase family 15 protein [Gaiellaceae bacterium]|nr:glycoside hydrolase family 15 protein [Gaiellaceae bacterium]